MSIKYKGENNSGNCDGREKKKEEKHLFGCALTGRLGGDSIGQTEGKAPQTPCFHVAKDIHGSFRLPLHTRNP